MRRGSGGLFQFDHMNSNLMVWLDLFLNKKGETANIGTTNLQGNDNNNNNTPSNTMK